MGILYKLTFASGKLYIGVTESKSMTRRLAQHRYKAKQGSKLPVHLAWIKHGEPEVEILQRTEGDALYQAEIDAIKQHGTITPNGYNLLGGGQKSPALNKSVAEKIRKATIERYKNPEERAKASLMQKNRSQEVRKKISEALTGKKISEDTKQKLREANLGNKHSAETKAKMSQSHKGKEYSEETLERMGLAARKRMQSPEAQAQLKAASLAGGNATKAKAQK